MQRRILLVALLSVTALTCRETTAVVTDPHLERAEELLARYVAIDTSGGTAGYAAAVELLAAELRANGVTVDILTPAGPGYPIVYARLKSRQPSSGALVLMHHMDVVEADATQWSVPPFAARRTNGYLWGRGAVDDKSLGIAHLESFLDLHRRGVSLEHDLVFLAVPDEEKGGAQGVGALLEKYPDLFSSRDVVLTEGGSTDTKVDAVSIWSIDVAQKVPLWIRITSRGSGGHGATSSQSPSEALVSVLSDLRHQIELRSELDPEVVRMIESRARAFGGNKGRIMARAEESWSSGTLHAAIGSGERSVIQDSMVVTTLRAGHTVNVVPSVALAEIDFRLLRSTDVAATLGHIRRIAGERASVEVLLEGSAAPASPVDHPLYRILERELPKLENGSIVVPAVSPATTDARYFRKRGVPAYGFSPFKINFYDAAGIHGNDERIRIRFFHEGVRAMREIVRAYCVAP